jgi:hypothetical protein
MIPISQLKLKYQELADQLITDVNKTSMTLYFRPQIGLTNVINNFDNVPKSLDEYGGRVPVENLPNRTFESGINVYELATTGSITVRAYWENIKYDRDGNVIDKSNICKIISYLTDMDKLLNTSYATIQGINIKMQRPPIPYGLFERRYSISFWEQING